MKKTNLDISMDRNNLFVSDWVEKTSRCCTTKLEVSDHHVNHISSPTDYIDHLFYQGTARKSNQHLRNCVRLLYRVQLTVHIRLRFWQNRGNQTNRTEEATISPPPLSVCLYYTNWSYVSSYKGWILKAWFPISPSNLQWIMNNFSGKFLHLSSFSQLIKTNSFQRSSELWSPYYFLNNTK